MGYVFSATVAFALAAACGSSSKDTTASTGTAGAGGAAASSTGPGLNGSGTGAGSSTCENNGDACGDGGVCAGKTCCDSALACGGACCDKDEVCTFQKCEKPGATCVDDTDCPDGDYCDYSLGTPTSAPDAGPGCMGGVTLTTGKCLPIPPQCPDGQTPGNPVTCLEKCEYKPPTSDFTPVLKYVWGGETTPPYSTDVMMAPIVINLDDDNCDGKVDQNDIPEIVFTTFSNANYSSQGTLHAISIVGGQVVEKWTVPNIVNPGAQLAAADLDGDGVPEIVGCMTADASVMNGDPAAGMTGVIAFKADGSTLWTQPDTTQVVCGFDAPVIGDLDGDGQPEVVVGHTILDGKTGAVKLKINLFGDETFVGLSDVDGDGKLDIVDGRQAYRSDGTVLWDLTSGPDAIPFGYHAVGDFDKDGIPEVVVVSSGGPHTAYIFHYDKTSATGVKMIRRDIDINNGVSTASYCGASSEYGGGPPTVADFDGDGYPDVGMAGAVAYTVLSGKLLMDPNTSNQGTILWSNPTHDCSSAVTGSSVFDFNGDGKNEVIYSDEYHLWMYDGPTGASLIPSTCNTTGTLWEYPLVADVDNDGEADIVVASNAYGETCPDDGSKQSGIRIFGSASGSWVRTRRIWNEHTYHITNINEDGTVPKKEAPNWTQPGLDDYRTNKQPGSVFGAPDAVVSLAPQCDGGYSLVATVRNLGEASMPAGIPVGFYEGAPGSGKLLGTVPTTKVLFPAGAENVTLTLMNPPADIQNGKQTVYAVVDDGMMTPNFHECDTTNNTSPPVVGACASPK